jgi:DNA-binding PadR family transcriptional regulator
MYKGCGPNPNPGEEFAYRRTRHRGGPFGPDWGFGPRGPFGPGPWGPGGRDFPYGGGRGRRRRGDIRTALLLLLGEGPANGYQLMQEMEQRSGGEWRPSPGSVYPALSQLEDEGLIRSAQTQSESGRTFEITDAGRQAISDRGQQKAPWESDDHESDATWGDFKRAIRGTAQAAMLVAHERDPEKLEAMIKILNDARKQLFVLLQEDDAE